MAAMGKDRPADRHGRRMLASITVLASLTVGGASAVGATVDADVTRALAAGQQGDRVPVVVVMKRRVNPARFGVDHARFERALRQTARASQGGVARVLSPGGDVHKLWLVNAVAGRANTIEVARLVERSDVKSVQLDAPVARIASLATSPLPDPGSGNWGTTDVQAPRVWEQLGIDGRGITIGSIDTGADPANPALAGRIANFKDFVSGRAGAYDDNGHGTHTASTMVGVPFEGAEIGIAPGARVIVAKAMDSSGIGSGSALLAAAQWMADPDGNPATADYPAVVNNSWSAPDPNDPWFRSLLQSWVALGITPVFASGNNGSVGSPAGYPEVITVGAYDQSHEIPGFSGRSEFIWKALDGTGPASGTVVRKPDLVAPGVGIMSGYGRGWMTFTGTSMAAPAVAATAAMMRQANPGVTTEEISRILRATARDIGAPGQELASGAGALDTLAAVAMAAGRPVPAGATEVPQSVRSSTSALGSADAPRSVNTSGASSSSGLRRVRVKSGSARTVLSGLATKPTRLRVTLTNSRTGKTAQTRLVDISGEFSLTFRPRHGSYRIDVRAPGRAGALQFSRTITV